MFALLDFRLWGGIALGLVLGFVMGNVTRGAYESQKRRAAEAGPAVAGPVLRETVTVVDRVAVDALQKRLELSAGRESALKAEIERVRRESAKDTGVVLDCRLPDGLRDAINRDLATGGAQ